MAAAVLLGGCAPAAVDPRNPVRPAVTPTEQASAILDRPRSPGEEDGLEVVRWSVADNETAIRRALARHGMRDISLGTTVEALERHGFRAAVIAEADLPKFLIDIGGTTTAITVWFGQVPSWRDAARTMLDAPRVAMISGRAERLHAGWLRLMVRSWTVPLEEGAVMDLQVAPQLVSDAPDVSDLRNRDVLRGTLWPEATVHAELPRASALVILSAPPKQDAEEDPEGPAERPDRPGVGPEVELPPTLGEFLLTDLEAVPHRRTVLVLRARLPDILFAPTVSPLAPQPAPPGSDAPSGTGAAKPAKPVEPPPADAP